MKSFFTWFIATLIGAAVGFGISWLTGLNIYLGIGIGIILGSSAGVTANIHRGEQVLQFKPDEQVKESEMESESSLSDAKTNDNVRS
jgi:hypothetical protein